MYINTIKNIPEFIHIDHVSKLLLTLKSLYKIFIFKSRVIAVSSLTIQKLKIKLDFSTFKSVNLINKELLKIFKKNFVDEFFQEFINVFQMFED